MNEEELKEIIDKMSKDEFIYALAIAKRCEELQQENAQLKEQRNELINCIEKHTKYYDVKLGMVDMMGNGNTRVPCIETYRLNEILESNKED